MTSPETSPGELTTFTFAGDAGCFVGQVTAGSIALTPVTLGCGDPQETLTLPSSGTLTPAGKAELADLIAVLPISGPADPPNSACNDSSHLTVGVDFVHGGSQSYTIDDCVAGPYADFKTFVVNVGFDIATGSDSADVTID